MKKNCRKTLIACYLGFITQAIAANFAPLLFLTFHNALNIPLGKVALISALFFFTQLIVDFVCAKFVDRVGYRKCIVLAELLSAAGLVGLAFLPALLTDPFTGITICTVTYAIGSGLIEVLCSPIVEACPFENKEGVMSLLHSFYCWGSAGVIFGSTLFFAVFGVDSWRVLACIWALIPLYNIYNFAVCPIESLVHDGRSMTIGELFKSRLFWVLAVLMICAGASELSMAQWASAFTESALGVSKTVGDVAGPGCFAVFMGIARVFYGKYGEKMDLKKFMIICATMCLLCYLLVGLSANQIFGLLGCALCGFSVAIMWPGSISISSGMLPRGGTAMFALLALFGDLGGAIGPSIVGTVSQYAGNDLRIGLLSGVVFPTILVLCMICLCKKKTFSED